MRKKRSIWWDCEKDINKPKDRNNDVSLSESSKWEFMYILI